MKFGVVIISYNNLPHIADAIDSVRKQSVSSWTAVAIDNGSTDGTFERVEELVENDNRFQAFKKSNEGPSAGRNMGFSKLPADVEYIHFLDGDDVLHPDFLKTLGQYLDENREVGLVGCQFNEINNEGDFIGKGHRSRFAPSKLGLPADLSPKIKKTPFVTFFSATGQGPYTLYRKSIFEKTGGFIDRFKHEDTDMFCKMSLLAEVHYLDLYLYDKRRTENNLAHSKTRGHNAYGTFRNTWDNYIAPTKEQNELLVHALKYYYTRHKPFRDLKVALKAFKVFLVEADFQSLKWCFVCCRNGLNDILFNKTYKIIMSKRMIK